jgi:hypothetical protein
MRVVVLVFLGAVALASCSGGGVAFKFYVVVEPDASSRLTAAVAAIAKDAGMETAEAQDVADSGSVMKVFEGRGNGLVLWMQSAVLSGKEDPELCGVHSEPYADPAQLIVFTQSRFFGSKAEASKLGESVFVHLQKLGFDVRRTPVVCGLAALKDSSRI